MTRNTNKTKEFSEKNSKCGSAGIGRQARLRGVCPWRTGSSPVCRTILVRLNGCSPLKARIYGLFSCFSAEKFKVKTMDAFSWFSPTGRVRTLDKWILSNKTASFEQISLPACRFFIKKHSQSLEGCFVKYHEMW